ncbi:MAG TPA: hypothetical protein PLU22_11560 [Polyangiaceae bacterium]|nr:hypothetical protein [Polyangiaceae bacterium]
MRVFCATTNGAAPIGVSFKAYGAGWRSDPSIDSPLSMAIDRLDRYEAPLSMTLAQYVRAFLPLPYDLSDRRPHVDVELGALTAGVTPETTRGNSKDLPVALAFAGAAIQELIGLSLPPAEGGRDTDVAAVGERDATLGRLLDEIQGLRTLDPVIVGTGMLERDRVRPVEGMKEKLSHLTASRALEINAFIIPADGAGKVGEGKTGAPAADPGFAIVPVGTLDEAFAALTAAWWERAEPVLAGLTRYLDALSEDALAELERGPAVREDWGEKRRAFHDKILLEPARRYVGKAGGRAVDVNHPGKLLGAVVRLLRNPPASGSSAGRVLDRAVWQVAAIDYLAYAKVRAPQSGSRRSLVEWSPAPSDVGRLVLRDARALTAALRVNPDGPLLEGLLRFLLADEAPRPDATSTDDSRAEEERVSAGLRALEELLHDDRCSAEHLEQILKVGLRYAGSEHGEWVATAVSIIVRALPGDQEEKRRWQTLLAACRAANTDCRAQILPKLAETAGSNEERRRQVRELLATEGARRRSLTGVAERIRRDFGDEDV